MRVTKTETIVISRDGEKFADSVEKAWREHGLFVTRYDDTSSIFMQYTDSIVIKQSSDETLINGHLHLGRVEDEQQH